MNSVHDTNTSSNIRSVERAFTVLEALRLQPGGANATTIAKQSNLPRPTVIRLLTTLKNIGAVERIEDTNNYQIGLTILTLAAQPPLSRQLTAIARSYMQDLAQSTGETVFLCILDNHQVHYIDQINSQYNIQLRDWTGARYPLHTTSTGRMLLAALSPEALERYLARPLERYTKQTITDPATLRQQLAAVKKQGYAWSREQTEEGLVGVAAPIYDQDGQIIAAVSVGGPAFRFPQPDQEQAVADLVVQIARQISERV